MTTCVSCGNEANEVKYTHRNEEDLPLCIPCWNAALKVQQLLAVPNKAEAARQRYQTRILLDTEDSV